MTELNEMTREELIEKVQALKAELENEKTKRRHLKSRIDYLEGKIEGLKYGIRCNGVSGGEVG